MTYEPFLDMKPSGGYPLTTDPEILSYLQSLTKTAEGFVSGWADHYPTATPAAPAVASKAFTAMSFTTTSLSITKPASIAVGDLIVVLTAHYTAGVSASSVTGFTRRGSVTTTDGTDTLIITAFDRIADGTEGATFALTLSGTTNVQAAALRVTGASSSPYVTMSTWASNGYKLERRLPSVTTTSANNLLIGWHHAWYGTNSNAPSGWTAQYTDQNDAYLYNKVASAAGATGNTDFDDASTYNLTASIVLAYKGSTPSSGYSVLDPTVPNTLDNDYTYSLRIENDVTVSDTWTGADGTNWTASGWGISSGTYDINSNRGRLVTGTTLYSTAYANRNVSIRNGVFTFDCTIADTNTYAQFQFCRSYSGLDDHFQIAWQPQYSEVFLKDRISDSQERTIASTNSYTQSIGDVLHFKVLVLGSIVKVRLWKNAETEPSTWLLEGTSDLSASGTSVALATSTTVAGLSSTVYFDNFAFAPFRGGSKAISKNLASSTFGQWIRATAWANCSEAHLILANDTTPTDYYRISIRDLLTTKTDNTWQYVTWSLSDMQAIGSPDISDVTYIIAGSTGSTAVRFGRFVQYPFANETLMLSVEALLAPPNAAIYGQSNYAGTTTTSTATFLDDFDSVPDSSSYIKWGPVYQDTPSTVTLGGGYAHIKTTSAYEINNSDVVLKTSSYPTGTYSVNFMGMFPSYPNGFVQIYMDNSVLGIGYGNDDIGYVFNTYATSTDRWWKISESNGTVTFARSADGVTYTTIEQWVNDDIRPVQFFMNTSNGNGWVIDSLSVGTTATQTYDDESVYWGQAWYDITADVAGMQWRLGGNNGRPETGEGTLTLENTDNKYSLFSDPDDILGGDPDFFSPGTVVRWGVYGTSHWFPLFTGTVRDWKENTVGIERASYITVQLAQPTGVLAGIEQAALGAAVGDGEDLPTRIARLLTTSDWQYGYDNTAGSLTSYTLQGTVQSMNRLGECYLTADSANATFRSSRRGKAFTYRLMSDEWRNYDETTDPDPIGSTLPDVTAVYLSRNADTPLEYEPNSVYVPYVADSLKLGHDRGSVVNEVSGQVVGSATVLTLSDVRSAATYGTKAISRTDLIAKDTVDLESLITRWLTPEAYAPASCEVHALTHPHCLAWLLMADIERIVFVKAQDQVIFRTLIGGISHSIIRQGDVTDWSAQVSFKPYTYSTWWRI